jgi:hypothetical protein
VYFIGGGIFALIAILCVFAFFKTRSRKRHYEETGELD